MALSNSQIAQFRTCLQGDGKDITDINGRMPPQLKAHLLAAENDIADLKARVVALEARVAALEAHFP